MTNFVRTIVTVVAATTAFLAATAQEKAPPPRTLKVNLHYTGAGTVDDKHLIFAFLFDSPDFMKGQAMPIAFQHTNSKDGVVTFSDLARSPVYVSVAYDPNGAYDGQSGPPPSGSSLGMYMVTPGEPGPIEIEPGKTTSVDLPFDDSYKMK